METSPEMKEISNKLIVDIAKITAESESKEQTAINILKYLSNHYFVVSAEYEGMILDSNNDEVYDGIESALTYLFNLKKGADSNG